MSGPHSFTADAETGSDGVALLEVEAGEYKVLVADGIDLTLVETERTITVEDDPVQAFFEAVTEPDDCVLTIDRPSRDGTLVDEPVEVRIDPPVIDLLVIVLMQYRIDRLARRLITPRDDIQEVTLNLPNPSSPRLNSSSNCVIQKQLDY